jgi:hypothetical protein
MSDTLQVVLVSLAALIALAALVRPYLPGRARSNGGIASPSATCAKCAASHVRRPATTPAPRTGPDGAARSSAASSRPA